ncbi:MAG TPA: thioesterase family protein [Actinomycetota bacterium]|nr:thioesterase family protein [Actinomycetota bacterium]
MTVFEKATSVRRVDQMAFEATMDGAWWGAGGPHGGYLSAILLRAMTEAAGDPSRAARSLTVHFAGRPVEGPARISAMIDRVGRSITYVSATLDQGAGVLARAMAAFSVSWDGFEYDDARMPDLPGPSESMEIPTTEHLPPFLAHVDSRAAIFRPPLAGAEVAETAGWMRFADPVVPDPIVVAMLADTWLPSPFARATRPVLTPTVDLTVHFCAALPIEGARPGDYVLGRFASDLSRQGFFVENGELWSESGVLLARSRQHALALFAREPGKD